MAFPVAEHICQLFDTDESRAESVAAFLADGLRAGDYVIAVPRSVHWTSIAARLEARGVSVQEATAQGRLSVHDAMATLARLTPRGRLNPFAFNEAVAAALKPASGAHIRAWGEMVDILAERGDVDEALELEELWNRVAEMMPMTILCSYTAAHFVSASTHRRLRDICVAHTDVRRDPQDSLANWILTAAHQGDTSTFLH